MTPRRIQRKRSKGWRMPKNTVYVGRGSRWGNPHKVGPDITPADALRLYSCDLMPYKHKAPTNTLHHFLLSIANIEEIKCSLKGKNLACWCDLDKPCHADVLLSIANDEQ